MSDKGELLVLWIEGLVRVDKEGSRAWSYIPHMLRWKEAPRVFRLPSVKCEELTKERLGEDWFFDLTCDPSDAPEPVSFLLQGRDAKGAWHYFRIGS